MARQPETRAVEKGHLAATVYTPKTGGTSNWLIMPGLELIAFLKTTTNVQC
jgi:hypothetical protein